MPQCIPSSQTTIIKKRKTNNKCETGYFWYIFTVNACWYKMQWLLVLCAAGTLIFSKQPAVLVSTAFVPSEQMWAEWKRKIAVIIMKTVLNS
jgi:hypothetical protein